MVKRNLGKKILSQKKCWVKKIWDWRNLKSKKFWVNKSRVIKIMAKQMVPSILGPQKIGSKKLSSKIVSPHNRPVCLIPDRSIIIPDRPISFRNMGPVRRLSKRHYRTEIWLSKSITGRESGHDMTKMHFSIFYSEFSDFSPMTPWSGGEGGTFKLMKFFCAQSL